MVRGVKRKGEECGWRKKKSAKEGEVGLVGLSKGSHSCGDVHKT